MIQLTPESKEYAIEYAEQFNNLHVKRYAEHVTIQYGYGGGDILDNLRIDYWPSDSKGYSASLVGMAVQLKVVGYVYSPQVQALKVEPIHVMGWSVVNPRDSRYREDKPLDELTTSFMNEYPHVTISTSKEGRPVMSNGAFSAASNPEMVTDIYYRDVNGPILTGIVSLRMESGEVVIWKNGNPLPPWERQDILDK